jgi:hypothetical protein
MPKPSARIDKSGSDHKVFEGHKLGQLRIFSLARLSFFQFALGSMYCWWGISLCSAAIFTYAGRHSMNPDGLSYLDLASAALTGGPSQLVNGHWSPGYPALISVALFLFHPSPSQEFPLIHVVNFLVFSFALWAFSLFLRYSSESIRGDEVAKDNRKCYVMPLAFCTFLWFTLIFTGTGLVTPDLCVAAIVFLAAGFSCRLSLPKASWKHYGALGFVLGVGYYIKAPLLPLGVALLVLLFFLVPLPSGITRQKLLLSLAFSLSVLVLVVTPLIVSLSLRTNRLSFGEAGRLNYLWFANGLQWTNGTGAAEEHAPDTTPEHPAPKLLTTPLTLQFPTPIKGTYPLWYDPSYWYACAKVRFDVRQQIAVLINSLKSFVRIFLITNVGFLAGAIVLGFLNFQEKLLPAPRVSWWQLVWPVAAFSMYGLVHVEPRYVGPFLVLFWMTIYRALMFRVNKRLSLALCAAVLLTVMLPFTATLAGQSVQIATDLVHPRRPEYEIAALGLRDLGLRSGDRLAIVGYAYDCYYARYDRLRVVAQIPDANEFWRLSPAELKLLEERLTSIGVKAVVVKNRPDVSALVGWKDINVSDSVRLSVLLLSAEAAKNR